MNAQDVASFERCLAQGGVALFPADTVYGLAAEPDSPAAVERLCRIKGRSPRQPSAVMFFALDALLDTLPELEDSTRRVLRRLLPGAVTAILANPRHRYPLACAATPERIGVRVPALSGAAAPLGAASRPVLQSSANLSGRPEARRIAEVEPRIRAAVELELDGGELPGTASTVIDLSDFERAGSYRVLREGALPADEIASLLGR